MNVKLQSQISNGQRLKLFTSVVLVWWLFFFTEINKKNIEMRIILNACEIKSEIGAIIVRLKQAGVELDLVWPAITWRWS